jgi:hypothetical protein
MVEEAKPRKLHVLRDDLTTEQIIAAIRRSGGIVKGAANALNVSSRNLRRWIDAEPELKAAAEDVVEDNLDLAETGILRGVAAGNFEACRYYLRCKGRHRGWIEVVRGEFEGHVVHEHALAQAAESFDSKFAQILAERAGETIDLLPEPGAEGP